MGQDRIKKFCEVFVDLCPICPPLERRLLPPLLRNHPPNLSPLPENLFSKPFRESVECELTTPVLVLIRVFSVASKTSQKNLKITEKSQSQQIANPKPRFLDTRRHTTSVFCPPVTISSLHSVKVRLSGSPLNLASRFALSVARL